MSFAKWTAITTGFAAAFGLGVLAGPRFNDTRAIEPRSSLEMNAPVAAPAPADIPAPQPAKPRTVVVRNVTTFAPLPTKVAPTAPQLHDRLKPVLKSGANMSIAAEGFQSAEQFATVAHASKNVGVPFMLLKHRVLDEGDTLVAAIRKSNIDVDAIVEADRARAEARSDLAALD